MPRGNEGAGEAPFPYLISPTVSIAQLFKAVKRHNKSIEELLTQRREVPERGSIDASGSSISQAEQKSNTFSEKSSEKSSEGQETADRKGLNTVKAKNKATAMARSRGVQFPGCSTIANGFIHSIYDPKSNVKPKPKNIFETK